jgi:hypothetical protein
LASEDRSHWLRNFGIVTQIDVLNRNAGQSCELAFPFRPVVYQMREVAESALYLKRDVEIGIWARVIACSASEDVQSYDYRFCSSSRGQLFVKVRCCVGRHQSRLERQSTCQGRRRAPLAA